MSLFQLRALLFFFFFFLVNIFAFSIAVKALHDTKTQVIWFRTDDGRILNATVVNGGNGNGYDTVDWIVIKNLINWGIWKLIGQVDLATDGRQFLHQWDFSVVWRINWIFVNEHVSRVSITDEIWQRMQCIRCITLLPPSMSGICWRNQHHSYRRLENQSSVQSFALTDKETLSKSISTYYHVKYNFLE